MSYADYEYYSTEYNGKLDEDVATAALETASMHIDSLTFNRIEGVGFSNLTPFQCGIIQKCCCMMADFETENEDMINSLLSSYSLNGASMTFSGTSAATSIENGVVVKRDTYAYLMQTGLCTKSLGGSLGGLKSFMEW